MWMAGPDFDFKVEVLYVWVGLGCVEKKLSFDFENVAEGLDTDPLGSERVFECGWSDQILASRLMSLYVWVGSSCVK
jgi:hypothetical protein